MATDFHVTIHGERGEEWERIAGTATFPVQSPIPVLAELPGRGTQRVFLLAIDELEASTLEKIVAHLAAKFGVPPEETEAEVRAHGIPILDEECSLMIQNPQKWLS